VARNGYYDLWQLDTEFGDVVELVWQPVMAPGIQLFRDQR